MIIRTLALSLIVAGAVAVGAAFACSCMRQPSAAAHLRGADLMFIGRAERTTTRTADGASFGVTRFSVQRTLKGRPREVRDIGHSVGPGSMCGIHFQPGQTYTIIASETGGRLHTGACSRPQFPLEDYERALAAP